MTRNQALKLAIGELRHAARGLAFDANLAEKFGATFPQATSAARRRRELLEAAELLEAETKAKR